MKKYSIHLINLLLITSLITGCSKKEEIITNQNIVNPNTTNQNIDEKQEVENKTDKEEFSDNEDISNNTIPREYEEVSYSDYTNPIYTQMSTEFFEATDKIYAIDEETKNSILNLTESILEEIEKDKNVKFTIEVIEEGSTSINNSSKTLKININQIYGIKELTKLPMETVTRATILHEIGHYFTQESNGLLNSLIFESVMNNKQVMELTKEELEELIILPEVEAWEFVDEYMNIEEYEIIKKYALSTYYDSYTIVIDSNEPIKYNDSFSIKLND